MDSSQHVLSGRTRAGALSGGLIDDATSWSWGRFVERDSTPFNMAVLWEYLEKHGRMVDVYTDRDSMFAVPSRPGESKQQQREADRLTQLGRATRGDLLPSCFPAAQWTNRAQFSTAQYRLVKQLRLAKSPAWPRPTTFRRRNIGRSGMSICTAGQGFSQPASALL